MRSFWVGHGPLVGVLLCSACARPAPALCPDGPIEHQIAYPDPLTAIAVDPSTTHLGVGSRGGNVALIELAGGTSTVLGNLGYVQEVVFSPDGKALGAHGNRGARIWDVDTGKVIFELEDGLGREIVFSPTEPLFATCRNGEVQSWSTATGAPITTVQAPCPVAFAPDGRMLVTSPHDGNLDFWRADGTRFARLWFDGPFLTNVAFSPDGTHMALVSRGLERKDGAVAVWELFSREREIDVEVNWVTYSADGDQLIMAGPDRLATIWSAARRTRLAAFEHETEVWRATLSFSGARLATFDLGGTITLWDVATREPLLRRTQVLEFAAFAMATTDDRLFSSGPDGSIHVDCR